MKEYICENIFTWGLTHDKDYGGYKLPVSFRDESKIVNQIQKMVIKQGVKPVFYGDSKTLYFKLWNLSEKQSSDLLEKGRCYIDIKFVVRDKPVASKKTEELFLGIEILGLRLKSKVVVGSTPDDEF